MVTIFTVHVLFLKFIYSYYHLDNTQCGNTTHLTFFFTILFFTDAEEMMRRLDRLESQLSSAANIADNTTKQQLPLQSIIQLLENRQFHKLLDIHNIIQTVQCFQCPPTPLCCDAKVLVREVRNKRVLYKFYYCW